MRQSWAKLKQLLFNLSDPWSDLLGEVYWHALLSTIVSFLILPVGGTRVRILYTVALMRIFLLQYQMCEHHII